MLGIQRMIKSPQSKNLLVSSVTIGYRITADAVRFDFFAPWLLTMVSLGVEIV